MPASGAPRDAAAQKKIEEAMYTHFLNMDFDTAEGLLLGTFRACEDKCSPQVRAKLWMYVGIVRGSGRRDLKGADDAFQKALAEDPGVALDKDVASPEVQQVFEKARGKAGASGAAPAAAAPSGGMKCSLQVSEVQSRRPIPIECESDKDFDSAELFYKNYKVKWTSVKMTQEAGLWRGTIPCAVTQNTGTLNWYVEGYNDDEEIEDNLGDEDSPQEIEIVDETEEEPPAYPEEEPPARCGVAPEAAGGGPGCGGWGASCGDGGCCETGLTCIEGTCEEAGCSSDNECDGGECKRGKCVKGASGEYAKNYFGIHFGVDVASISSDGACSGDSRLNDSFTCTYQQAGEDLAGLTYAAGQTYEGFPNENFAGSVGGGFSLATMRVMASYERLLGPVGLEARLGFAFNGGPSLMPFHGEVRAKYWFTGTSAFSKAGPRVWAHLGGGVAQVDATVPVDIKDCTGNSVEGEDACMGLPDPNEAQAPVVGLDATKQLGLSFVELGTGLMWAFGPSHGAVLNVNGMLMLPATGIVIQPTLGYVFGL